MAISITALTNGTGNTQADASSYATGTISDAPTDTLLLARILTSFNGTSIATHTCSGLGLTWEQVNTSTVIFSQAKRHTLFRAVGAPSSGAITFSSGAETQSSAAWAVYRVDEAKIGNNGADAIIQSVLGTANGEGESPVEVPLNAFADAINNACLLFGYAYNNVLPSASGSLSTLTAGNQSGINMGWIDAWQLGEDTSPGFTMASGNGNAIGVEIAQAVAGGGAAANQYYGRLRA